MLDRADYADFGYHNSIRLKAEHFLTFISFSGCFVFAVQKCYLFFASDPLVLFRAHKDPTQTFFNIFHIFCPVTWKLVNFNLVLPNTNKEN